MHRITLRIGVALKRPRPSTFVSKTDCAYLMLRPIATPHARNVHRGRVCTSTSSCRRDGAAWYPLVLAGVVSSSVAMAFTSPANAEARALDDPAPYQQTIGPSDVVELGRNLGKGSFGDVRVGVLKDSGKKVAVKALRKDQTPRQSVAREADMLRRIQLLGGHDNIVRYFGLAESDKEYLLITNLLAGVTLHDYLQEVSRCPERMAARCVKDIAEALSFLHNHADVVHNDIKPENLMLVRDSSLTTQLKLIDFGSASDRTISASKPQVSGTKEYWPPEIIEGGEPSPASDMWSLGCVLYIMLTGRHPFDADGLSDEEEIEERIKNADLELSSPEFAHLSDLGKDLILKLLERDPSKRITAEQLLAHPWLKYKRVMLD